MSDRSLALRFSDWLAVALGLPPERVILADQGKAGPKPPYATVRSDAYDKTGSVDESRIFEGNQIKCGERESPISVNIFGTGALKLMRKAIDGVDLSALADLADSLGFTITETGQMTNVSAMMQTEREERAHCDFIVTEASNQVEDPGFIESVTITGKAGPRDERVTVVKQ